MTPYLDHGKVGGHYEAGAGRGDITHKMHRVWMVLNSLQKAFRQQAPTFGSHADAQMVR